MESLSCRTPGLVWGKICFAFGYLNTKEKQMKPVFIPFPYPYLIQSLSKKDPAKASLVCLVWEIRTEALRIASLLNTSNHYYIEYKEPEEMEGDYLMPM